MHLSSTTTLLACVLACLSLNIANRCEAGYLIALSTDGSARDFEVAVGESINIPVYIVQQIGESGFSAHGLYSAGVTLRSSYESGANGNAQFASATIASHWDSPIVNYIDTSDLANMIALDVGREGPPVVPLTTNLDYVLLGTIEVAAGTEGNVTSLSLSSDANFALNLLFAEPDGLVFSPNFVGGRVLTITATPEPSTMVLLLVPGAAFGLRKLRKRVRRVN